MSVVLQFAVIGTLLVLTGCANKVSERDTLEKKELQHEVIGSIPSWVNRPELEDLITAVGAAKNSQNKMHSRLIQAQKQCRIKLANQLKNTSQNDIDKTARTVNSYLTPEGTLYVLMAIDKRTIPLQ